MDNNQDDFPAFGKGFQGFPKRLPDDCVEYSLFIIDAKLKNNRERLARLESVRKESLKLSGNLLKDYIWQRDYFHLDHESKNGQMYLHGLTNYGDSVEDEWLVVYILRELSKRFPELWIKVVDTDGEFLLIEAANALPRWLNPEIADNRVWINNSQLKIIPITNSTSPYAVTSAPESRSLTEEDAVKIVTSDPNILIHSPMIEEEAFYRLKNYPGQIIASLHHALATIPRKLAHILHELPTSIAPAVEAFYLRDPISLKPLQQEPSSLLFPPTDLVTVSTRFTKVLYAQLKAQQFPPPLSWKDLFNSSEYISTTKSLGQLELGMKVASGYEMLVTDTKNKDNKSVREINILLEDLNSDNDALPSDAEISSWKESQREDDEKWLDINYEDFENELSGNKSNPKAQKSKGVPGAFGPDLPPGFGDPKTESDLKKMVERFEAFLNDDDAGIDGAEMDDMDVDDDDDDSEADSDGDDDEDEDREVSFDEAEFAKMMREMMGMPSAEEEASLNLAGNNKNNGKENRRVEELDSDVEENSESEDEEIEIRKVMEKMEAELNEAGALNLDPTPRKMAAIKGKGVMPFSSSATKAEGQYDDEEEDEEDSDEDGEVNIDYNLAKNLLESFKSQGGMSGPAGNILGSMGIRLPRDADDERNR